MIEISLAELEAWLIQRKRELGITGHDFLPRNDGTRRTESKRRLLAAISDHAELWATGKQATAHGPADESCQTAQPEVVVDPGPG
jgi:hypothetical protein